MGPKVFKWNMLNRAMSFFLYVYSGHVKVSVFAMFRYGSFPVSGMGQYGTVRYDWEWKNLIQLAFTPTVSLLDRCIVCRKVAIDDKTQQ